MSGVGEVASARITRRTFAFLLLIFGAVALLSAGTVSLGLYRTAVEQHRQHLGELAESWARQISSAAELVGSAGDSAGLVAARAYPRREQFAATGEYALARREGERIELITSQRGGVSARPKPVPWDARIAEPLRRALGGETGTLVGLDYRGTAVLAAYRPIPALDFGLVVKIDRSEVRAPFVRAALAAVGPIAVLLLSAAFMLLQLGRPMVRRLAESEERYRVLVDSARDGIITAREQGEVVLCNRAAALMFGYAAEQMIGRSLGSLMPARLRAEQLAGFERVTADSQGGRRLATMEAIGSRKDGTEIPLEISLASFELAGEVYFSGVFRDISDRRRWQEDLERLAAGIDQVGEAVMIADRHGVTQYVNPAFERITGYSTSDAVGQTPRILKSGKHSAAFYEDFWHQLSSGSQWQGRLTNRRKDGSLYVSDAIISPVLDGAGQIVNYVSVARDITEALELEAQVRRAQKMDAVGQLACGVAHDFNNLLTGISGYVQLSQAAAQFDDQVEADLDSVLSLVGKARDLTSQLLMFSRREPTERQNVDLAALVEASTKMLARVIAADIEVEVSTGAGDCHVHADAGQMEQVLMNLVVNARDAMAEGGRLAIRTAEAHVEGPDATKLGLLPGAYAVLTVADDGHGMDASTLDCIFDAFFTTKARSEGTGLGLTTAYGIVQDHGGVIYVQSRPGEGATFNVYLPRTDGAVDAEMREEELALDRGAGETILLVEDEKDVLEVLHRMLSAHGYKVLAASHPEQAERLYAGHSDEVALLLTDIVMPGCSGVTLYRRLAEQDPDLEVVFMAGYTETSDTLNELLEKGASLMRKPFSLEQMAREIRVALDR